MGASFEFNGREIKKLQRQVVRDSAAEIEQMFQRLRRQYQGRPVSTIKPVLKREWAKLGGKMTDTELTEYATLVSEGARVTFKAK